MTDQNRFDFGGTEALLEIAHRFGLSRLTDTERYGLGLTIGGGEVRLLDLANAYAALGAQGRLAEPFAVQRVRDRSGAVLYARPAPATRQVLSAEHAYLLSDILSDADARKVFDWYRQRGLKFQFGKNEENDLTEQQVQPDDLPRIAHLRQDDAVEARARRFNNGDHVAVRPLRGGVINPDCADLAVETAACERLRHVGARLLLGVGRHRVFQIQEDLVGGQATGLRDEPGIACGHCQA